MSSPFIFKQFNLEHSQSAFKLGTDSVLLGSWLPYMDYREILDIGGGTGIISLMMAQRFKQAKILSVEVDECSVSEMANNFTQSVWSNRLTVIHDDVMNWNIANRGKKFDLMITNPPYFTQNLKNPDSRKARARHTDHLDAEGMAQLIQDHLFETGNFACILPTKEFDKWAEIFERKNIYINHLCNIRSFDHTEIVRKIGVFSFQKNEMISEDHFIYNNDKSRSSWYTSLTSEFYIK